MPISRDQARDVAKAFLDVSHDLGSYRFAHWARLTPAQRRQIEDAEWDLLNDSSSFITTAVGITLNDMEADLKAIREATALAGKVVATIKKAREVIQVAAAMVAFGGAIASRNPSAIADAACDLSGLAEGVIDRQGKGRV